MNRPTSSAERAGCSTAAAASSSARKYIQLPALTARAGPITPQRRLSAAVERFVLEVVDHERTGVQHFDGVRDQHRRRAAAAGEGVGLLEQVGPEPLAANPGIEVGGQVKGLGPAMPSAGGLVRRARETQGMCGHVGTGFASEMKDLANRIGASPVGGLPITIRTASEKVKRCA